MGEENRALRYALPSEMKRVLDFMIKRSCRSWRYDCRKIPRSHRTNPMQCCYQQRGNVEHLTHPFVCHIYIGICVINEGTHLGHDVIPLCLLFGGDERKDWGCHVVCFVFHVPNMAYFWAFFKGFCASTPTGFLPLDFSTLTCKDNRLPNHNGRNILRGSYHRAD